ncbi:MAG TPA: hypothetical protein VGU72_18950 [Beijerinckiaceae bacterium]|jgi:hypothetical protein|nr:hypothetical protein [Beijerinckiaceae bacterium]
MEIESINDLLNPGYLPFESGYKQLKDERWLVAALTRMQGCRAKMIDWWFSWLGGIDQYIFWHPRDHVFSDWENRVDGKYIGSSHLVHEYLGGEGSPLYKLRINIRDPREFYDPKRFEQSGAFAITAIIGDLEHPVNFGRMTHFIRDTDYGCEMRSRFWLGYIASRDPAVTFTQDQQREIRRQHVTEELARRLHQHAVEEMGYLAEVLPTLYRRVTQDNSF